MRRTAIPLALLVAVTAIAYLPARDGQLVFDDWNLLRDPRVVTPRAQGLAAWLAAPRPVTAATFALDAALGEPTPRALHRTSLAVHLAAVLLAWLLARESLRRAGLERPGGAALAAAAIFALHPLQTESVAYLSQRAEALAAALLLAALLVLLARDRARPGARLAYAVGAVGLHALALGAKPVAATLPALWLLHVALLPPPGEEEVPALRRVVRRLPLAAALLVLSGAAVWSTVAAAAGSAHAGFGIPALGPATYAATQLQVVPEYLRLVVWPAGQCGDCLVPAARSWLQPGVIAGALLLAALAAAAVLAAVRAAGRTGDGAALARTASFGALFFLLALAPSSSLFPLLDTRAEHRVYLALLGPALAAAAAGVVAARRLAGPRALAAGLALAVAASGALAVATWRRSAVWATNLAFWSDAATRSPAKARVLLNLGISLSGAGRQRESLAALLQARALSGDGTVSPDVLGMNLVTAFLEAGLLEEARAVADGEIAAQAGAALPWAHLAAVEYAAGRDGACEEAARTALGRAPSPSGIPAEALALKWLGLCRLRRGDHAGAIVPLGRAAKALPGDPELGAALRAFLGHGR